MTVVHRDNDEILGSAELDDIEAILSISNQDLDEVEHAVHGQRRPGVHLGLLAGAAAAAQAVPRRRRRGSGTPPPTCRGTPRSTSNRS